MLVTEIKRRDYKIIHVLVIIGKALWEEIKKRASFMLPINSIQEEATIEGVSKISQICFIIFQTATARERK